MKQRRLRTLAIATAAVLGGLVSSLWAQPRPLPDLGGGFSVAVDVNESGMIVGAARNPLTHVIEPAVWVNEQISLLPLSGSFAMAKAVNAEGTVVGYSYDLPSGRNIAFIWKAGELRILPDLGEGAMALDINDAGDVVGYAVQGHNIFAVAWRNEQLEMLSGAAEPNYAAAVSINNQGVIGGFTWDLDTHVVRPTKWEGGARTLLTNGPVSYPHVFSIAEDGTLIGTDQVVFDENGSHFSVDVATRWTPEGPIRLDSSLRTSGAFRVSQNGLIAGYVSTPEHFRQAVVWKGSEPFFLPTANEFPNENAYAVLPSGLVVGNAFDWYNHVHYACTWDISEALRVSGFPAPGAGVPGQQMNVRARATNIDGKPVRNREIDFVMGDGTVVASAMTDRTGLATARFEIPRSAKVGNHEIMASMGGGNYIKRGMRVDAATTSVTVGSGAASVGQFVTIRGRLMNSSLNEPITGQRIRLRAGGRTMAASISDSQGRLLFRFQIPANMTTGNHTIQVDFAGDAQHRSSTAAGTLTVR
jgi:uncharacterized membrane protein